MTSKRIKPYKRQSYKIYLTECFVLFCFFFAGFYSTMISHVTSYQTTLMAWLSAVGFGERYWAPCYKGSVDGWYSKTFHSKCDSKGPSLTLARKGSYLFGGFADRSWKSEFLSSALASENLQVDQTVSKSVLFTPIITQ